jgi:hypothetical protein
MSANESGPDNFRLARHLSTISGNCGTLTRESRWEFTVASSVMSSEVLFRIAQQNW